MFHFLHYFHKGHKEMNVANQVGKILDKYPQTLSQELYRNVKIKIIENIEMFKHFSKKSVDMLVDYVEDIYFMPN